MVSNGHTSGQMLPVSPPPTPTRNQELKRPEAFALFLGVRWSRSPPLAPSAIPGSTVPSGEEGVAGFGRRRRAQPRKGTLSPAALWSEGQRRTKTGLLPRATIFSLPLSLRNSPLGLLTPQGQQSWATEELSARALQRPKWAESVAALEPRSPGPLNPCMAGGAQQSLCHQVGTLSPRCH